MVAAIFNFQFINLREEEVCINIFKIFKILKGGGGGGGDATCLKRVFTGFRVETSENI